MGLDRLKWDFWERRNGLIGLLAHSDIKKCCLHSGLVIVIMVWRRGREGCVDGWMHGWIKKKRKNMLCNQDYKTVSS